jgi:hypothetical protein
LLCVCFVSLGGGGLNDWMDGWMDGMNECSG